MTALGALRGDIEEVKSQAQGSGPCAAPGDWRRLCRRRPQLKGLCRWLSAPGPRNELKSMSVGSLADSGYDVPQQIDVKIAERLRALSPIHTIAQVVQTGSSGYHKLVSLGNANSGWVAETAARAETTSPKVRADRPADRRLYANPRQASRCWTMPPLTRAWLADEITREFARAEAPPSLPAMAPTSRWASSPRRSAPPTMPPAPLARCSSWAAAMPPALTPRRMRLIDMVMACKPGHRQGCGLGDEFEHAGRCPAS